MGIESGRAAALVDRQPRDRSVGSRQDSLSRPARLRVVPPVKHCYVRARGQMIEEPARQPNADSNAADRGDMRDSVAGATRLSDSVPNVASTAATDQVHVYVDAATRISRPRAFDRWYYAVEDGVGQGTVGMGVCLVAFVLIMVFAFCVRPI